MLLRGGTAPPMIESGRWAGASERGEDMLGVSDREGGACYQLVV